MVVAGFGVHAPLVMLQVNCCEATPPGNISPLLHVKVCGAVLNKVELKEEEVPLTLA